MVWTFTLCDYGTDLCIRFFVFAIQTYLYDICAAGTLWTKSVVYSNLLYHAEYTDPVISDIDIYIAAIENNAAGRLRQQATD